MNGDRLSVLQDGKSSVDGWWGGSHDNDNVVNGIELHTSEWLRWSVFSYVYFTAINAMGNQ